MKVNKYVILMLLLGENQLEMDMTPLNIESMMKKKYIDLIGGRMDNVASLSLMLGCVN